MKLPECDNDVKFMYSKVLGHCKKNLMRVFLPLGKNSSDCFCSGGMLGSRNTHPLIRVLGKYGTGAYPWEPYLPDHQWLNSDQQHPFVRVHAL